VLSQPRSLRPFITCSKTAPCTACDLGANHFDHRSAAAKAKRLVTQLAKLGYSIQLQPLREAA
jgi:hypothetical protein